jgi:hypothetical protein
MMALLSIFGLFTSAEMLPNIRKMPGLHPMMSRMPALVTPKGFELTTVYSHHIASNEWHAYTLPAFGRKRQTESPTTMTLGQLVSEIAVMLEQSYPPQGAFVQRGLN